MNQETSTTNLVAYVSGFMAALSLFSLVDAGQGAQASVAAAATSIYLLPLLALVCAVFLGLAVMVLSRSFLVGGRRWNSPKTEETVLVVGLATACLFGVLALLTYVLATLFPGGFVTLAIWITKSWAVIYAICFGALAYESRPGRRGAFMAIAAMFLTIAIFGMFF